MCWCQCQWANSNGFIGLSTCTILSDGAQTKRSVASAPIQGIKCLSSKRLREKKKELDSIVDVGVRRSSTTAQNNGPV